MCLRISLKYVPSILEFYEICTLETIRLLIRFEFGTFLKYPVSCYESCFHADFERCPQDHFSISMEISVNFAESSSCRSISRPL